jgi:hypothetical protein
MKRPFLAFALAAVFGALALAPAGASAATPAEVSAAAESTVSWIRGEQAPTTGALPGVAGEWSMSALAAAGVSPAEVRGPSLGAPSLDDYFLSEWTSAPFTEPTDPNLNQNPSLHGAEDFARVVLNAFAGGLVPSALSAEGNAVAQLASLYRFGGSYGHDETVSETAFGTLAMNVVEAPRALLAKSAEYFRRNQDADGGWTFTAGNPGAESSVETTGVTLAALCTTGATAADPAVSRGVAFLESRFDPDTGAFETFLGPDADANAWALDGLRTCEIDTGEAPWTTPLGKSPADYLLSLQRTSGPNAGSFEFEAGEGEGEAQLDLDATQNALRALTSGSFYASPPVFVGGPSVPAGTPVPLTLLIDNGRGSPRLCRIVAPTGSTIVEVLEAAETEASGTELPCVAGLTLNQEGVLTGLNGTGNTSTGQWVVRSAQTFDSPPGSQEVELGDFVRLRFPAAGSLEASIGSLNLGEQIEGTVGRGQSIYVRVGEAPLEPRFSVTGPRREDFLVSAGDCQGTPIEPGSGCTVQVRFAPASTGAASASLHLLNANGTYGPPIGLSGNGIATPTSQGPVGPAGLSGAPGATGSGGPVGPTGATGPKGEAGEPGPRGKAGKSAPKKKKGRRTARKKNGRRGQLACKARHRGSPSKAAKCIRKHADRVRATDA